MKKQYDAIKGLVLALVLLFAGVQGVFAAMACEGTVYFKLPAGWKSAYAVAGGQKAAFTKSPYDGWLQVSTDDIGGPNNATGFNIEETGANDCNSGHCVRPDSMNVKYMQMSDAAGFKCVHMKGGSELWIQAHPDTEKENVTYYSATPPDVKYFYVFLPENAEWKSAIPMIVEDDKPAVALEADPDRCGWYFRRYIDEVPPAQVVIYRDDDEQKKEGLGMDGDWGTQGQVDPIPLATMFEFLASNEIYFVATEEYANKANPERIGWTVTDDGVSGACGYNLAAMIYDTDASLHGAFTCNPDWFQGQTTAQAQANACYYSTAKYNVVNSDAGVVPCIGVTPGMVEEVLGKDKKPKLTNAGKKCFGSTPDEAFTAMFNPTAGINEAYCFNLPFTQTKDGKYEFDSDNYEGPDGAKYPAKGGFYPAEQTPSAEMFLEGSTHLAAAENKRKAEGPVFVCANYNATIGAGEGLRAINPTEGVPEIDLFCKGPGWSKGIDCSQKFAAGSEFTSPENGISFEGDGWGWSCPNMGPIGWTYYKEGTETPVGTLTMKNQVPEGGVPRWTSGANDYDALKTGGRNQHFCFESHATFRYKKGLRFSFRGDDDIWVYIDNKLAVDLGGTHLAAPGYVDLDKFVGNSGGFTVGTEYDIDIFFCDRRTTMSNVRIKTNMFIKQTTGLAKQVISKKNGVDVFALCYAVSSNGSCGGGSGETYCEQDLLTYLVGKGKNIDYTLTDKKGTVIKTAEEMAQSIVYFGGIDLTNRADPKIDKNTLSGLAPNDYVLWASIDNSKEKFEFTVEGNLEVLSKHGTSQDEGSNKVAEYDVVTSALASSEDHPSRVPIYISSIMDQGETVLIDLPSAVDQPYGITVTNSQGVATNDVTLEVKDANGNFQPWNGKTQRMIGESGIDTIYASLNMAFMSAEQETYDFAVTGHTVKTSVTFYVPKLVFVESETSSKQISGDDPTEERFVGPMYTFYILALAPSMTNPGSYEECGARCNFALAIGSETSQGITTADSAIVLVDGRATFSIYSTKEYRTADGDIKDNPATLSITGPQSTLIKAKYTPLHFRKPPVPYPVFADIFDVRGKVPAVKFIMDEQYFDMNHEYLDGIADSLVIYYNREFYNSPDSLPNRIVVYWEGDKDSVVVERDAFAPMLCGSAAGLDDTLCMPRVTISGVNFSKDIKTANPNANLRSYARYSDRGRVKEDGFPGNINDRVAPIIKAADVRRRDETTDVMTLTLSESVVLKDANYATTAFTVYLNSAANLKSGSEKYIEGVKSASVVNVGADKVTIFYSGSDDNPTPHTGDYIRFRTDNVIWADSASPVPGTDPSLRPSDDASFAWNSPTSYNSEKRLPSPWTPVTGEAEVGVKSIVYTMINPDELEAMKNSGNVKITSVKKYPVTTSWKEVQDDNPGRLGYFLKSDMNSLVNSDTTISKYFNNPEHKEEIKKIYLEVEMDLFTNLGNFVAHSVEKIPCVDPDDAAKNNRVIFGEGHSCLDTQLNFFISWNLVSSDKRIVGTGAYVSKMTSSVHLAKFGKKNKMEETQMWGVRRTKKASFAKAEIVNE